MFPVSQYVKHNEVYSAGQCDSFRCWASISQSINGDISDQTLVLMIVLKCTTKELMFEINHNLIDVKLHNGSHASRPMPIDKDKSTSHSFSIDQETINEYNGKDISRDKLTKIELKNNDWIQFKVKVKMVGCTYEVEALKRISVISIVLNSQTCVCKMLTEPINR